MGLKFVREKRYQNTKLSQPKMLLQPAGMVIV